MGNKWVEQVITLTKQVTKQVHNILLSILVLGFPNFHFRFMFLAPLDHNFQFIFQFSGLQQRVSTLVLTKFVEPIYGLMGNKVANEVSFTY